MKIKEFFKYCAYCNHVWIFVCQIDELGERQFDGQEICDFNDLNKFIDDYGDEEIDSWSVENAEIYTEITFDLKRYI